MTEWEFLHTCPKSFFHKVEGFKDRLNIEVHSGWEQTRWLAITILNTAGKSSPKTFKEKDFVFEWEKKKSLEKKEVEKHRERFEELKKKWHKAE